MDMTPDHDFMTSLCRDNEFAEQQQPLTSQPQTQQTTTSTAVDNYLPPNNKQQQQQQQCPTTSCQECLVQSQNMEMSSIPYQQPGNTGQATLQPTGSACCTVGQSMMNHPSTPSNQRYVVAGR